MKAEEIAELIEAGLPGARVRVISDDDTHFEAIVISESFDGKRALARHQLVYRCLGARMGGDIHALSIRAHTPREWQQLDTAGGN
ncbi:MAG TPA: BolA/IbaG family iron-sulfur metabolism protein [Woeseiaceae bacterium]|nr:BolA/IbaG family iron-sulfur metabolism protein [Woeseiaceae bacterium]